MVNGVIVMAGPLLTPSGVNLFITTRRMNRWVFVWLVVGIENEKVSPVFISIGSRYRLNRIQRVNSKSTATT